MLPPWKIYSDASQGSSSCVSIYLPTHRSYPDSQQDSIRFQQLVQDSREQLKELTTTQTAQALMEPFNDLMNDGEFWTHRWEGLAVLRSPETFDVSDLPEGTSERVVVADSFHLKPLVRMVQRSDRFHVLALQREQVTLFEGQRDRLKPIEPEGIPLTAKEALINEVPPAPNQV